ncbi:sigma-70 family RNA polymerase sigma factor [Candidatus Poribacteria bacterium]
MRTDDGSIIYRCLNGEPEAFGILVDKYKEGIYAFVYTKLRDFRDAQDVTQEVFVKAYGDLRSLRRWESFSFWLYRIASTRCKLWIRTQSRRLDRDFIEDQEPGILEDSSVESYRTNQTGESLRAALDSLPEAYREVLVMHYFGGMSSKEIAGATGTSPGAIRVRLNRGRTRLREEMIAMMDTAFEGQRLPIGFTFRIVEAAKRIKMNPMPRMAGLPWGLSLAMGIIITVLSINPHISINSDMAIPAGSPLPVETRVLKTGEIPVDVLEISQMLFLASKQDNDDGGEPAPPDPQNAALMAAQGEGGIWARKEDMPTARYILAVCVVDGTIYAIGGGLAAGCKFIPPVEAYDPVADNWIQKKDMPTAKNPFASVVDGIIYVIGGRDVQGRYLSTVEAYDPAADVWIEKADMPTARDCPSTSAVDGIIYAIGGHTEPGEVVLSTVEAYDPAADVWVEKKDMPTPRTFQSTIAVDGIIYAIGGRDANKRVLSTVEAYDPATDTWTRKADMPTARRQFAATVLDGIIYAMGGSDNVSALSVVEAYDPAADAWIEKPDIPTARAVFSAAVVNGKIYTVGGTGVNGNWNSPVAIVEEYTPGDPQSEAVSPQGKLPTMWGEVKQRQNI